MARFGNQAAYAEKVVPVVDNHLRFSSMCPMLFAHRQPSFNSQTVW
jgi:hypothetical protein